MTRLTAVDSDSIPRDRTHAHGVKGWGDVPVVSAQTGPSREGRMVSGDLVEQYAQALETCWTWSGRRGGGRSA